MSQKILYIEDNAQMQNAVALALREIPLVPATSLSDAKRMLERETFSLLLLDIELPDGNGVEFFNWIRNHARLSRLPVIIVTSHQETDLKVESYTLGAEDYITKPFDLREFRARIYSRLKRLQPAPQNHSLLRCGPLKFDLENQRLHATNAAGSGIPVDLTPLEYKLLLYFAKNEGLPLSREKLVGHIWGDVHVLDRTIDTHISRIRRKLEGIPVRIDSIYGKGYALIRA